VEGKRLQVNSSAERYQRELAYLLSILNEGALALQPFYLEREFGL